MTQVYQIIAIVAFSLMGVSFVLAMFFWFRFRVWKLIGDLSGRTARKSIERMRQENAGSGRKTYRSAPVRTPVQGDIQLKSSQEQGSEATTVLGETDVEATQLLQTEELSMQTEVLQTSVLQPDVMEETFEYIQNIVCIHTEETI